MWLTNQKKLIFFLVFSKVFPPHLITQFCFLFKGPLQNGHIPARMRESWMIEWMIVFTQYQMYLLGAVCVFVFTLSGSCSDFTSPIDAPAFRQYATLSPFSVLWFSIYKPTVLYSWYTGDHVSLMPSKAQVINVI